VIGKKVAIKIINREKLSESVLMKVNKATTTKAKISIKSRKWLINLPWLA
jgi:hypothetical protein